MGAILGGLFGIIALLMLAAFGALLFVGVAVRLVKRLITGEKGSN